MQYHIYYRIARQPLSWLQMGTIRTGALVAVLLFVISSCKKFIEIPPPGTSISDENIYQSDATAASVMTGFYAKMSDKNLAFLEGDLMSTTFLLGLYADELTLHNLTYSEDQRMWYQNELNSQFSTLWKDTYNKIYTVNAVYEGVNASLSLNSSVKQQIMGEARFVRAFLYFYLLNYFGDVPLALSTDYTINAELSRTATDSVYQQIVEDLIEAQQLLSSNYLQSDLLHIVDDRVRPTRWAATALLARVYLYKGDFLKSEEAAGDLISSTSLFDIHSITLNDVFKKNSSETIWALQPTRSGFYSNTGDGFVFVLGADGPTNTYPFQNPVYLSDFLLNSFEMGDLRKANWTNSVTVSGTTYPYAYKYKIGYENTATQEYSIILRLAEQYLIRAESRAKQGNLSGAQEDLNIIRNRAGLPNTTANTQSELLLAIMHERQVELFAEWGHRWFDLKRSGSADAVMSQVATAKGGSWEPFKLQFPIPQTEIDANPKLLGHQNPGY